MSGIQNLAAVIASISVVGGSIYAFAIWQAQSDIRAAEIDKNIRVMGTENASLRNEIVEIQGLLSDALDRIASIENVKSNPMIGTSGPNADEVAAVLVQEHLDVIRGPKGDKGDPGPTGPRGPEGASNNDAQEITVTASNAFVPLDLAKLRVGFD